MANPKFKAKIILGSSSMARRKILAEMGYDFTVMAADIDEKSIRTKKPEDLVLALAEAKADAIISRLGITGHKEENAHPTLLITADTVYFHDIPDEVIDRLVDDGVTLNVAGGLMLEHPLTAPFVDTVIGTPDGVMGLSKSLTEKLLEESL
ncbi:maf-like protein DDB_G0281937 isoform X4 [Cynara cardunculus var. scolymus]|uniref:maf-like protein DDB_G0281937 isoform X4 n=1 Tax=Cynara cardunculus var. scolymus TaxID=59895 RepID=UPI000D629945|nr:maf-like protein DDB_G0281937 isoform X4 [Cynara cardunculus var. scolymus]